MEINKQDIEKEREIIKELQRQLAKKDAEIERLNDRLDKYISGRLKSMLAEKDNEINNLKELRKIEIKDKKELRENQLQETIKLEKELAEKDKEIEEYNNYFKSFGCKDFAEFQRLIGLTKISAKDKERDDTICKQVCDEIRQKLKEAELMYVWKGKDKSIETIIDQIEKGEEK